MTKPKTLLGELGFKDWGALTALVTLELSYRMFYFRRLERIPPDDYPLEEWNKALDALGLPREETSMMAKYALERRMKAQ